MSHTHYLDCGEDELPRYKPPHWYVHGNKQSCSCGPAKKVRVLASHTGFSDSCYRQLQCEQCSHIWVDFIEG